MRSVPETRREFKVSSLRFKVLVVGLRDRFFSSQNRNSIAPQKFAVPLNPKNKMKKNLGVTCAFHSAATVLHDDVNAAVARI